MIEAIQELLDALEAAENAEEGALALSDTVIRESFDAVILEGFINQRPGYRVPGDLLLNYTPAAERQNSAVITALTRFLDKARAMAPELGLDTAEQRRAAWERSDVSSSSGDSDVGVYFC